MSAEHMSLDNLPAALRDRAGKIGTMDANTAEYLTQAANAVDRLRRELVSLRRARKQLQAELDSIEFIEVPDDLTDETE